MVGNKRPPPDVPAATVQPRVPNRPGESIPAPKAKIPTSSQRPGKRTNDTIPYARMVFTAFNESPADPSDMLRVKHLPELALLRGELVVETMRVAAGP